jgi:hypothetical protein
VKGRIVATSITTSLPCVGGGGGGLVWMSEKECVRTSKMTEKEDERDRRTKKGKNKREEERLTD